MAFFGLRESYRGYLYPVGRLVYSTRAAYRWLRVTRPLTALLGPQYHRSRNSIEIDVTYDCNLLCYNCNRSCRQAPDSTSLDLGQIKLFVSESMQRQETWKTIRVLGGEPTLHPDITRILQTLVDAFGPKGTVIELTTNGLTPLGRAFQENPPLGVTISGQPKTSRVQSHFTPFNAAPVDCARFLPTAFRNGCHIPQYVGMGLGPYGYYCCAIAAGIDRVVGYDLGRKSLPHDGDPMHDQMEAFCRLCGLFAEGHHVPDELKPSLDTEVISPTWRRLYDRYASKPPVLTRMGPQSTTSGGCDVSARP